MWAEDDYSRPNESNGEGGGESKSGKIIYPETFDMYKSAFDSIRNHIDSLTAKWCGMPEINQIHGCIKICKEVISDLAANTTEGGDVGGSGPAAISLKNAVDNSAGLDGMTMLAFQKNYLKRIGPTMDALDCAAHVAWQALECELKAIQSTKKSVLAVIRGAQEAFERIVGQNRESSPLEVVVGILNFAFQNLSSLLPIGNLAKIGIEAGLQMLTEVSRSEEKVDLNQADYFAVMSKFEAAMNEIDGQFKEAEERVDNSIKKNMDVIGARSDRFKINYESLHGTQVDNEDLDNGLKEVAIPSREKAYFIAQRDLPEVSRELQLVGGKLVGVDMPVRRSSGEVGIGEQGPQLTFIQFKDKIFSFTNYLATDVELGAKNFEAVLTSFYETDLERKKAFESETLEDRASSVDRHHKEDPLKPDSYDPRSQNKSGPR